MNSIVFVFSVGIALASPAAVRAEDSLRAAKDLYASAAYEDALAMLNRLNEAAGATAGDGEVDQYRAFCMFALGHVEDAEKVAESIVRRDPLTQLESADASPRIQALFTAVRQRLLPSLIRERYRSARTGFERRDFATAEPLLVEVREMIAKAEEIGVNDERLADISTLVDGFLQLIRAASSEQTRAVAMAAPSFVTPPEPATQHRPSTNGRSAPDRIYSVRDSGVLPPKALSQSLPSISPALANMTRTAGRTGSMDVVIDEKGAVVDVTVRVSLHPAVDRRIADAARRWRYQPATKDGMPVQFVKSIEFVAR